MLTHVVKHMATKDDIADLRTDLKGDIVAVATQVNSIETELRDMKHTKLQSRVADLEERGVRRDTRLAALLSCPRAAQAYWRTRAMMRGASST